MHRFILSAGRQLRTYDTESPVQGAGLTIGCRGCGAGHAFDWMKALRGGPAPLTLVSLGRP